MGKSVQSALGREIANFKSMQGAHEGTSKLITYCKMLQPLGPFQAVLTLPFFPGMFLINKEF